MIEIIFPPGCYGTYLSKCIYNYTNLRKQPFTQFTFDNNGSSHDHRYNKESRKYITFKHINTFIPNDNSTVVAILPHDNHNLDYYNNQFYKQQKGQLISYIKGNYTEEYIFDKLSSNWGIVKPLDDNTPLWILREWCSMWLKDSWIAGYNRNTYSSISTITVEANDIVESFNTVFDDLISKLNLTLTVESSIIQQTHREFQQNQKFHNAQLRCIKWVNGVISNQPLTLEYSTLFDEAYIQNLLRVNGYEIYCNNLNRFPLLSTDMKELIYRL